MKIAVLGWPGFGAVQMRGMTLCRQFGWEFIDSQSAFSQRAKWDTIIAIKRHFPNEIRRQCRRLIYDPVDCWAPLDQSIPSVYWKERHKELCYDEILATSPSCLQVMKEGTPSDVKVHLVKHHCDPRISKGWHNPDGPVVYAGDPVYISSILDKLNSACNLLGRELITCHGKAAWNSIRGASVALAIRAEPFNTLLNRYCKPQVKIENAAAAGVPVLSTNDPCSISSRNGFVTLDPQDCFNETLLANHLNTAIHSNPLRAPITLQDYLCAMEKIVMLDM